MTKNKKDDEDSCLTWQIDELPIYFPPEIRKIYEKIYIKNRKIYTIWSDKIGEEFQKDIDWWMTLPSFRNPYVSGLLNYLSVLDTISQLGDTNYKIVTQSKEISEVISHYFKNKKISIFIKENKKTEKIKNFIKSVLFQISLFFYINIFVKKRKLNLNKKITIVDQFITLKKKQNSNIYQFFKDQKDTRVLIVPTFVPTLNFFRLSRIINELTTSKKNYLFKEHYLKLTDLFFSFFHIRRRRKFLTNKFYYKKFNVTKLVKNEISNFNDYYSINVGILNYMFFARLSENNIDINKSINWFENQIIDKGWNLGFRKYYPKVEKNSLGYQDFNKHYNLLNNSPSLLEYNSKVTPEKIVIISKIFEKITKEFFSKQKIILGKSWRFRNIQNYKTVSTKKKNKILLILCGYKKIDTILLNLTIKACSLNNQISIYIKPHPVLSLDKIIPRFKIPKNMIICNDNLQKILSESYISITAGPSSALLESVCMGVFTILPDIESGTNANAKIFKLDQSKYTIVKNASELLKKIIFIKENKKKFILKKINLINR